MFLALGSAVHATENPMQILPKQPTDKAPAETFAGDAYIDRIVIGEPPSRIRVTLVRFAPGARNAWHVHALGQTVHVTDGVGRIQSRGGAVLEIRAGDTVHTAAGEWHWHGAAPDRFMTHLAMWEAPTDGGADIEWGSHVTDDEYAAAPTEVSRSRG
jgi:quercetin dioxygenase-like cupin family protein